MKQIDEAMGRTAGARFWRCALQVNPAQYASNYRNASPVDEDKYNAEVAAACGANGVEVVGLADHGNVEQLDRLRAALTNAGIVVFPGFEVESTEKVHIVCLYEPSTTVAELNQFIGALGAAVQGGDTRPSSFGACEIAKKVLEQKGALFLAHITLKSGALGRNLPHVWRDPLFTAAQIPARVKDLEQKFRDIVTNQTAEYARERPMAMLNAKDVATPADLADPTASTFIKMTAPSIGALRLAFLDPESRVRPASSSVAADHARIEAIAWDGGFLDGVRLRLSENLNALVGGRGTGKSTLIESLRFVFGITPRGESAQEAHDAIIEHNLGAGGRVTVRLHSSASLGRRYTVLRQFGSPPEVRDDSDRPSQLPASELMPGLEILGQDEILEITKDRAAVRALIESYVPSATEETVHARRTARLKLAENRAQLCSAQDELDGLQASIGKLPKLEEQLGVFRQHGIEKALATESLLAREDAIVAQLRSEFSALKTAVDAFGSAVVRSAPTLELDGLPSADVLREMGQKVVALGAELRTGAERAQRAVEEVRGELNASAAAQSTNAKKARQDLDAIIKALPNQAGKTGKDIAAEFRNVVRDAERLRPERRRVEPLEKKVVTLRKERAQLLAQWRDMERAQLDALRGAADQVNKGPLAGTVRVSVTPASDRTALKLFVQGLDRVGAKRAEWVDDANGLTVHGLVTALEGGKDTLMSAYQTAGMTPGVASVLAGLPLAKRAELEEIELLPEVALELNIAPASQPAVFKSLDQLSTGQRCTAVLYILLSKGDAPLLVDQPEDHLDNAFIADLIVRKLRETKGRRQFVFATHNANIPVLGDAELIAVLRADNRVASLPDEALGSVDVPEIQKLAADVLEGGREAFSTRQKKYGFS